MNTILDIIHNASWIELIISVYALCLILLIVNMGRMENGARCLISLSILTFFLIDGLAWLEDRHDTANFFLYWAIGGAIGQFTFAGAVLLGIFGGLPGVIVTLLLGFFLCPLLWLRLVFSILWVSLAETPKLSLAVILCVATCGLYASAPGTSPSNNIILHIINGNFWDTSIFTQNRNTNITITNEAEKSQRIAKRGDEPVCYAVTVEGYKLPAYCNTDNPWELAGAQLEKIGEQTLILYVDYKASDLYACCGGLDTGVTGTGPIFFLRRGIDGQTCEITERNPAQMRVVTNDYESCTNRDLKAYHDSHGKLPDFPLSYELRPGMDISLVPTALGNSAIPDKHKQALLNQVRRLKIKKIHYLDAEGKSHFKSPSPIRKAIEKITR